ncbi:ribonuclease HI [Lutibacter sp. B1]|uniref:ribonuclease HI n=1 Tax=Lutibacter sp. B1 TaxID=2725996 RepID=UPI001456AF9A|nr:ribonuclease HI [Lutibacter sp. B1]NLP57136.1 ribonuclease HI [Lutibacter sp. B1]
MTKTSEVHIFTDGACSGNPGPGGYGIVMEWVGKPYKKEFSEGFKRTTNNRMELLAVIVALEKMKTSDVKITIFSDSKYVVDAVEKKWLLGWQKKQFKDVKNPDLWKRFLKVYNPKNTVFKWVKGHNNHQQNERCDFLAVEAAKKENLKDDVGYGNNGEKLLF